MPITKILLDQVEQGNAVLFLGAGASFNAEHPTNEKIPNGQELSNMIASKFLDKTYLNQPLNFVSELAISQTDLYTVQKFIYDVIEPFKPAAFHKLIPTFRWRSIYTTNYDFIIERAYDDCSDSIQELSPVIRNTRIHNILKSPLSLPYYKVHGCLTSINDKDLPLILTPEQYIEHKKNRDRLFLKLLEEAHDFTFIFVGYSFADVDIRSILQILEQEKEGRPRFYMVGPGIRDAEASFWENRRISSIKTTFEDFLGELDKSIPKQNRILSKVRPLVKTPIFNQFIVDTDLVKPSESFKNFLENDIDYIYSSMPSSASDAKQFYKGYFTNWDPIIRNLDVERNITESILSEVFLEEYYSNDKEKVVFILIKGFAGSGKSVVLKRLAWDAAVTFDKLCIFLRPNTIIRYENIYELYQYCKKRIYIFIEEVLSKEELKRVLDKCEKENLPITFIGTERINIWNSENNELSKFLDLDYTLEYLNDKEINELIEKLTIHHSLGFLEGKPKEEQFSSLGPKAGRVLLVALYEATHGKPFREIVKDEYDKIEPDLAKSLYLTVSIFHMLGTSVRAGLISRVHGINFGRFRQEFLKPLEYIIFDRKDYKINDYVYQTKHPYIAQMIFETVLEDEQSRFDEFIRILTYLDIDFDSDRTAFIYLTNAKRLISLFPNRTLIDNIYKKANEISQDNPKLLQQQAILELERNNIINAEKIISRANSIADGEDEIVLHSFAEIEFKKAESAKTIIEKNNFLDKSISLCDSLIKKFGASSFSYHTILKSLNSKLELAFRNSDQPTIERLVKELEKKFRDAKQLFPLQEFILEAEATFNQIIHNSPEALDLLVKAHSINKSSPFIATRLSHVFENRNDLERAISVLKETLNHIPGDRDINYNYAMLLIKKDPTNYKDPLYYLRKSFTEGDSRYQAQFWYARILFLDNQTDESRKIFKRLSRLSIDPDIKNKPTGVIKVNENLKFFTGRIKTLEASYGFVKRDGLGDDIFMFRFENINIWDHLKYNMPIQFNIAFNYNGPVALNLKISK